MPPLELMLECICLVKKARSAKVFYYNCGGPGGVGGVLLEQGGGEGYEVGYNCGRCLRRKRGTDDETFMILGGCRLLGRGLVTYSGLVL